MYGIGPRAEGAFPTLHTRISDMAAHYVNKIRKAQPRGPYLLGGLGVGGVLAHEVACRLQSEGEQVAMLALLDSVDAGTRTQRPVSALTRRGALGKVDASVAERLRAATAHLSAKLGRSGMDYVRVRLLRHYTDRGERPPWFLEHIPLEAVYRFAIADYTPSRFQGRLTLFRATGSGSPDPTDAPARELCPDPYLRWTSRSTHGVDVVDVPGGHRGMLLESNIDPIARRVLLAVEAAVEGPATVSGAPT